MASPGARITTMMVTALPISRHNFSPRHRDLHATLMAFEEVVQNLDAVVWVADPRTLQVFCISRGADRLLGYASDPHLMDQDFLRHHIHPDDRDGVLARLMTHVSRAAPVRLEYRGVTPRGEVVRLRNHVRMVVGASGQPQRLLGVIVDVTGAAGQTRLEEQARAEAERLAANLQEIGTARDRFLATVVHELRNPIATMLAAVEMLRTSTPGEARFGRAVDAMERSLRLQYRLVEDLSEFSAAVWGQLRLRREVLELHTVVAEAVEAQRDAAEAASLAVTADLAPGLWVDGDRDRLLQAALNLIGNAIKYTPAGGEVRVLLAPLGENMVRLTIEDTGIGISPELLGTLFEIFRRGEAAANLRSGLGIGLALVRSIAELHDGGVWAESEGIGMGSRFTLELPAVPAPA